MTLYHALLLGLVQGITEFLPISSSGHLVLMQTYFGLQLDPSELQNFDIVLHGGSLLAILLYFRKTWTKILRAPLAYGKDGSPPLLLMLLVGTLPVAFAGYLSADWIAENARTPLFVAFGFIFTGLFLIVSGWYESRYAAQESLQWKHAIGAGVGQALGILPGFSRAGMTIASGRLMGLSATRATEFAFMLGAPALAGALVLAFTTGTEQLMMIGWSKLLVGFVTSLCSSFFVMRFLIATVKRYGLWMWSAYLFVAAALILGDEMLPFVREIPTIGENIDMRWIAGALFIAMLLEAAPFTSLFSPGFTTMVAVGILLHGQPLNLIACIPIATIALILGNLLGYIPARQARIHVRWKERADKHLTKAQRFFRKWGIAAVFFGGWYGPTRSVMSIAAGLANMRPLPYLLAITFGSLTWATVVLVLSALVASGVLS